jgi:Tol biopolymer transport system component
MTTPWIAATVLAIAAAIGWWLFWLATRPVEYSLMRLSVDLGPEAMTGPNITAAISPDGRRLVFQARAPNGKRQLATRLLDQTQISLLPGTEDGETPFFSPDSEWVGFFADGKLKKTSVQRGAPVALCDAFVFYGGSWGEDGSIIAALNLQTGLSQVPAAGGRPQPLTRPRKGEVTHRWPQILPGGKSILFTASPTNIGMENASIEAMSLRNGVIKTLVSGGYFGRYVAVNGKSGYLVYLHQDELLAVGFNPDQLETRGTPMPLLEDVSVSPYLNGGGQFDFSEAPSGHGTFVYLAGKMTAPAWPVMWLDNSGKMQPFAITPGYYQQPRFSPDGRHLALTMRTTGGTDIYVYELGRETMTRITFGGHAQGPVWTPDGKHIAFQWSAGGFGIGWIRSDGSAEPRQILSTENLANPYSLSPDGRRLAYYENNPETGFDIWTLPLDGSDSDEPKTGKPEPFLVTPSEELAPMFSPDGRWIAYRSNESGTGEIYVRPFPGGRSGKWQVSTGRGRYAMWSNNRRELFYDTADDHIMVLNYTINGDSFVPAKPRLWSEKQIYMPGNTNLTLAPDGKRFAVFPRPEAGGQEKGSVHATFLLNFFDELRRRVPIAQR